MASGSNQCPKVVFVRSPYVLGLKSPQTQGKVDFDHLLITARITPKSKKDKISFEVSNDERFKKEEGEGYEEGNDWVVRITITALAKTPADKKEGDADLLAVCSYDDEKHTVAKARVFVVVPTTQTHAYETENQHMDNAIKNLPAGTQLITLLGLNKDVTIKIYDQHNRLLSAIYDSEKEVVEEKFSDVNHVGGDQTNPGIGIWKKFSTLHDGTASDPVGLTANETVPTLTDSETTKWYDGKLNPKDFDGARLNGDNVFNFEKYRHLLGFSMTQTIRVHGWELTTTFRRTMEGNGKKYKEAGAFIFKDEKQ